MACALEFYTGKHWTGAPLHLQYNDWFSVGKGFGPLEGLGNVVPGEELLFMLVAGSLRLKDTSDQPGPALERNQRQMRIAHRHIGAGKGVGMAVRDTQLGL